MSIIVWSWVCDWRRCTLLKTTTPCVQLLPLTWETNLSFFSLPDYSRIGIPPNCITASVCQFCAEGELWRVQSTYLNEPTSDKLIDPICTWNCCMESAGQWMPENETKTKKLTGSWKLALYHKIVWREEEKKYTGLWKSSCIHIYHDEYGKVRINSRNGAHTLTLSVNWNFIEGVVQTFTHAYPPALNNDDAGLRTNGRVFVHEVYSYLHKQWTTHS